MELIHIISFVAAATLLVISPGPNGVLIAKTVPVSGKYAGFANIAGFVVAFYVHGTLSILGVSILLVQSSQAFFVFKMCGAAYLCWIGLKALWSAFDNKHTVDLPDDSLDNKHASLSGAFFEGFLTNVLNPKVSIFYLAVFPPFISVGRAYFDAFILVSLHCVINLMWFSAMVILLSRLKKTTQSPIIARCIKSLTGIVFIGFGTKLAFFKAE